MLRHLDAHAAAGVAWFYDPDALVRTGEEALLLFADGGFEQIYIVALGKEV